MSTMIMTLVALTGAVSHISLGARIFRCRWAVVVLSYLGRGCVGEVCQPL